MALRWVWLTSATALLSCSLQAAGEQDPFLWLEEIEGERALRFVEEQNARTLRSIGDPSGSALARQLLDALQSDAKIPAVEMLGGLLYNLWQDRHHVRGLWRRTTLEEYEKSTPAWETVLDLDALSASEGKAWVWEGCEPLDEGGEDKAELCLVQLSNGGADAKVVREFNLTSRSFLPPPWGFFLPEAKSQVSYQDRDTLLVGTNFGPNSMTQSGYPRTVRAWRRGTDLRDAPIVFEGIAEDVSVSASRDYERQGLVYDWRSRGTSFFDSEWRVRIVAGKGASEDFRLLPVPSDAEVATFEDQLLLRLKSDFVANSGQSFLSGSVVAAGLADVIHGTEANWTTLFTPSERRSCNGLVTTQNYLVIKVLDAVRSQLLVLRYEGEGVWVPSAHEAPLEIATVRARAVNARSSDALWLSSDSFLEPPVLRYAPSAGNLSEARTLKSMPKMFPTDGLQVSQRWVTSKDGTAVPYFLVNHNASTAGQPTVLYGYGGFGISLLPGYSATLGLAWLGKGGAYALANIRGGGEFGPDWHNVAIRDGRHRSYEDFAAVAEDLVRTGAAPRGRVAAMGGSNGGLLAGNMLVTYPDLFGAVVSEVPLLDMRRYTLLGAGASWVGEYGDPANASDWSFLKEFSPYQKLDSSAQLPPVLITTSTRDDRVHPAHARKMVAKLLAEVPNAANRSFLFESTEGGHASALPQQTAGELALKYSFLGQVLGVDVHAAPVLV